MLSSCVPPSTLTGARGEAYPSIMKLALVHPPIRHQVWAGVPEMVNKKDSHLFPPLSLMYLSAALKAQTDHQVTVLDFRLDEPTVEEMGRRLARLKPDLVCVTAISHNLINVKDVISAVRTPLPQVPIVMGGPHVNAFPEIAARLPGVDAVVEGDGELPLVRITRALEEGKDLLQVPGVLRSTGNDVERGPDPEPLHDLDTLPFPDRSWMPAKAYFTPAMREERTTTIIASRGCPYRCIFCSVPGKFRKRSPGNVVEEMVECEKRHGIREVHFVDDLFNITEERIVELSEEILRRRVGIIWGFKGSVQAVSEGTLRLAARAGCVRAHYGVETYSDEGLKALGKEINVERIKEVFAMTRAAGIRTIAYMIIGSPHERSREQILGCVDFVQELDPDYVVYSLFSPYPDTESFNLGVERGLWAADVWEKFMLDPTRRYSLPTSWTEFLSEGQLIEAFKKTNYRFYARPRTVFRTLTRVRSRAELLRIVRGGLCLLRLFFLSSRQKKI